MKKFNSNKKIIIALIVGIVVIFMITFTASRQKQGKSTNLIESIANDAVGIVDRIITAPTRLLSSGVASIDNLFNTYEENEHLKRKLDKYAALETDNQNYKSENEKLKEQLELNQGLGSYEKINANVISRSPDSWQDTLIIDRGAKDQVEVNMAVMGSKGLIGRIIEVNTASAKVELLTSADQNVNHFPVMITTEDGQEAYGLLKGYDEATQCFVISQLTTVENVKEGNQAVTSGLGGESPRGLYLGAVEKIKTSSFGLDNEVYVKPASSLYDIPVVTVVKRLAESEE